MRLLIAINVFFLSVQNVEDTDLWGYFFRHITLICVLYQTRIWGNIYFGGHRSEYDVRGHRSEEICFWKDIDLGVTSEDTDLRGQGFGRTWIWVWRNGWTRIWGKDTNLRPYMDLSLTYIYKMFSSYQLKMNNSENQKLTLKINNGKNRKMILKHNPKPCQAIYYI
jgi:hypothetical protein